MIEDEIAEVMDQVRNEHSHLEPAVADLEAMILNMEEAGQPVDKGHPLVALLAHHKMLLAEASE